MAVAHKPEDCDRLFMEAFNSGDLEGLVSLYEDLFTVAGPLAPATALCKMTSCLQQQFDWVTDCIHYVREHGRTVIEPTAEKEAEWVKHHDETANTTLVIKTHSWYMGSNVDGKPRRLLSYIGGVGDYRQICDAVQESGYEGFAVD